MKKHQFRLHIDNPCSEDLSNMLDTACGKFCNSCQKEVYDFTNLTDKEIYKIIVSNKSGVCAQIQTERYENGFSFYEEKENSSWLKYAASLLFIGGMTQVFSQSKLDKLTLVKTEQSQKLTIQNKDSITIDVQIINAVSNKPLFYPMLLKMKCDTKIISSSMSSDSGRVSFSVPKNMAFENLSFELYYLNKKNDFIIVPKEHLIWDTSNKKELKLTIRTAIYSKYFLNNEFVLREAFISVGAFSLHNVQNNDIDIQNKFYEEQTINGPTPANVEHKVEDANKFLYR